MTNVDKIHDLIGKIDRILDKLDDAESNLESFDDDLHSALKRAGRSNKWLKGEIETDLTWVEDWQENAAMFKGAFNQFKEYLDGILDNLSDWTSSDLIAELNKILKRYRYIKRWLVLIGEFEELAREQIDTKESGDVEKFDELTQEADQIYEDFYDDSDNFWDKDEDDEESDEEEYDEEDDSDDDEEDDDEYNNEISQRELNRYRSEVKQALKRTAQLRADLGAHNQWLVSSNNNIAEWYNQYGHTLNQWLYNEYDTILGWMSSFMKNANAFIDLFDYVDKYGNGSLDHPNEYNWEWVINFIQKANKRYDYIEKWMEYTEKYANAAFDELRDGVDAHVSRMNLYSSSVKGIMELYYDNKDGFWEE